MTDERIRDLERSAAGGDEAARLRLKAEQVRAGLRKAFPPRFRVPPRERAGAAFPSWCPRCRTWSLVLVSQKRRSRRNGKDRAPRRECIFGRGMDAIYESAPFRHVPVGGDFTTYTVTPEGERPRAVLWHKVSRRHAVSFEPFTSPDKDEARWLRFPLELEVGYRHGGCPGPASGEHVRIPLDALEDRMREAANANYWHCDGEIDWLERRIRATRKKMGLPRGPELANGCRHPRLDYVRLDMVDGTLGVDRTRVECQDCGVIFDAEDGRVVEGRVTIVGGAPGPSGNGGSVEVQGGDGTRMEFFQDYRPLPPPGEST